MGLNEIRQIWNRLEADARIWGHGVSWFCWDSVRRWSNGNETQRRAELLGRRKKTETLRLGVRLQLTEVQSAAWLTEKQEVGRRTMKEMAAADASEKRMGFLGFGWWQIWTAMSDKGKVQRQRQICRSKGRLQLMGDDSASVDELSTEPEIKQDVEARIQ